MNVALSEIAKLIDGEVTGNTNIKVTSLSPIDDIASGSLVFAEGEENILRAENSNASAVLVTQNTEIKNKPSIRVANPLKAFITLLNYFYPHPQPVPGIHPTAVIAGDVSLGEGVFIGPYVVIEAGSSIGNHCVLKSHVHIGRGVSLGHNSVLHPQVTVYDHCRIGNRVIIHASSVIGSDGFGYTMDEGRHAKIPHVGTVIVEDDVEIGANTVIDRATLGATVIGEGTKIDNLVQVAHSVKLGKHNILCAFTGIAGSTISGNHVIFAANVGVSDHVRIDDGVILGARAGVPPRKHLKQGNIYLGNPARPKEKALEQELSASRLPIMRKNLKALSDKVEQLAQRIKQQENQ
ncbi:UDP-3-O-(3-hydroxymyristoyl)glucosamine N-acyltransferase [Legionella londiniensis]|uniref:UDP-3-O-acylglucosamine N-acyltransferase n=1 Tax=Legionella londiniensis TaxID=45068 RepID=A0A0W0VJB3_9GAMM|nr:UDP-3-O-(3-hydroxymyristoyl)glucosamine N-acyltransferase [Legionella londiniensis]KTD20184.1 UDP-3-O-(R-3-hydroxymyristoyl)-glucosamine N-acyltransferase [Legionella londiniensis]STX94351.1 UDP-3-O-(R-3-hydroxymyristoyl)-glucosamine N-acyltransferase [Legionella londiniensis]